VTSPLHLLVLAVVIVDGALVPSIPPASVLMGRVVGPPRLVAAFADQVVVGADGTVIARRGALTCTAPALTPGDPPLVALAPLARCLGAAVSWDARAHTLALAFGPEAPLPTPTPPAVSPATPAAATPSSGPATAPPTASPRPVLTGIPMPRRTAIPALPSWPVPAATGSRS
jgi:hypothetical protein